MNRRRVLQCVGAASLAHHLSSFANQFSEKVPTKRDLVEMGGGSATIPKTVNCRVIGVGEAGYNIVSAAWSSGLVQSKTSNIDFACVSMCAQRIGAIREANKRNLEIAPIRTVQIGQYRARSKVCVARAAALKHQKALQALMDGAEVVILVAGVGGGTGSGVTPMLAHMAQKRGALTLAIVVRPFEWEFGRYPNAFQAIKELKHECHYLASLSNQEVGEAMGEDATLDDVIAYQERIGTACIQKLVLDGSRHCIDYRRATV